MKSIKVINFIIKNEKLKLGFQLCDFVNTNFNSFESFKAFVDKYSIVTFAELTDVSIYRDYDEDEYEEMIKNVLNQSADKYYGELKIGEPDKCEKT